MSHLQWNVMNSLLLQHLVEGKVMSSFNSYGSLWVWLVKEPVSDLLNMFLLYVNLAYWWWWAISYLLFLGTPKLEVGPFIYIQSDIQWHHRYNLFLWLSLQHIIIWFPKNVPVFWRFADISRFYYSHWYD